MFSSQLPLQRGWEERLIWIERARIPRAPSSLLRSPLVCYLCFLTATAVGLCAPPSCPLRRNWSVGVAAGRGCASYTITMVGAAGQAVSRRFHRGLSAPFLPAPLFPDCTRTDRAASERPSNLTAVAPLPSSLLAPSAIAASTSFVYVHCFSSTYGQIRSHHLLLVLRSGSHRAPDGGAHARVRIVD